MKLDVDFSALAESVRRMGASAVAWTPEAPGLDERAILRERLSSTGIEISLNDVVAGPGGLLTYKNEQVILYIKDTHKSLEVLRDEPEKAVRFHVADCRTLESMRAESRFERYVVTRNTTGVFQCDWKNFDTGERGEVGSRLKVCKNCLNLLRWRGYGMPRHPKGPIWNGFDLSDFLLEYATFFTSLPSRVAEETGLDDYVKDWSVISMRTREASGFTCSECGVVASTQKSVLHVHHKDRIRSNNDPQNLQVLCALCHRNQAGHSHMHIRNQDERTIRKLRAAQGIP